MARSLARADAPHASCEEPALGPLQARPFVILINVDRATLETSTRFCNLRGPATLRRGAFHHQNVLGTSPVI